MTKNREQWLMDGVQELRGHFRTMGGGEIPDSVRVTCGWPSSKALSHKSRRIGECWPTGASAEGHIEVMISPCLSDSLTVLGTLAHELVHATVGVLTGHGKEFSQFGRRVGLTGAPASMSASPEMSATVLQPIVDRLGLYPHAVLDLAKRPTKKQGTRMLKLECDDCGYVARTTAKWLEEKGALICPCNRKSMSPETPNDENV